MKVPEIIPDPDPTNQTLYRLYQINKKFINNNDNSKIYLTKEQINILNIYPEINKIDLSNSVIS